MIDIDSVVHSKEGQDLINAPEFYFQKGKEVVEKWFALPVSDSLAERLLTLSKDYKQIQEEATTSPEINNILTLLFEIISYCDSKAKDKHVHNKYDDKRSLANAFVRMGDWVQKLIELKLTSTLAKPGSPVNAVNYLLNPENNATILSKSHRSLVSENLLEKEYNPETFIADFKAHFSKFNLQIANPANYTHLLSWIAYSNEDKWKEEAVGLLAADGTGWQDEYIKEMNGYDAGVLWNSKKPSGTGKTIGFLRNILEDKGSFNLYYSLKGVANYRATIIDFAENQEELDEKQWDNKYNPVNYRSQFSSYRDDNKSAKTVFLASDLEKLDPIPISDFKLLRGFDLPRHDNLSPLKEEPESIRVIPISNRSTTSNQEKMKENRHPLNQIFFGPPGTGKTYNSIARAISIANPEFFKSKLEGEIKRKDIKEQFDKLVKEEQIMFTTFHQSMSYEDFIEGIKPLEPKKEGEVVNYKIVDGMLKKIAKRAKENFELSKLKAEREKKIPFDTAFDLLEQRIQNALLEDPVDTPNEKTKGLIIKLASSFFSITGINGMSIRMMTRTGNEQNTMTKLTLKTIFEDLANIEKYVSGGMKTYYRALVEEMYRWQGDIQVLSENVRPKDFVLIIDEINRGNVSQIFGELITLLEEDKRLGKEEALEATLAYSKLNFGIPPNFYVIGTMNTADRSVEALDAALRRRFSFEEMPPRYDLEELDYEFAGSKGSEILKAINKRIEKLLDKDHAIGHSYFLIKHGEHPTNKLITSLYRSIIPLLQEYFYGDYGKIGLVLGKGFVRKKEWHNKNDSFADFDSESASAFEEREVYEIIDYRKQDLKYSITLSNKTIYMDFVKAMRVLMKQAVE